MEGDPNLDTPTKEGLAIHQIVLSNGVPSIPHRRGNKPVTAGQVEQRSCAVHRGWNDESKGVAR
jgi:hypothetical protein